MDAIVDPIVIQTIGAAILLFVFFWAGSAAWNAYGRVEAQRRQQRQSAELLKLRADTLVETKKKADDILQHGWNGNRKFEIRDKIPEADGVHSFYLVAHDGKPLPPFEPGQYLTFTLKPPDQPKPIVRCYSLSDAPGRDYYRVSIKRIPPPRDQPDAPPGLSSSYFNDHLQVGDILDVKAPSGHFFLDITRPSPVVLIGGGIGITPVLSMLNTLTGLGSHREIWFFLGVRNSKEHVQKQHIEAIAAEHDNVHLAICYSDPLEEDKAGRDYQHKGWVGVDLFKEVLPSNNYEFYICGPPPMMNSVTSGLEEWGVPSDHVHFEAFGPASVKKKKDTDAPKPDAAVATCSITFAQSNKTITWDGSQGSILEIAEENGIAMDSGCRAGNCGTCITALKAGDVEYLNEPGAPPEKGSCLTCISVPKGDITLEA